QSLPRQPMTCVASNGRSRPASAATWRHACARPRLPWLRCATGPTSWPAPLSSWAATTATHEVPGGDDVDKTTTTEQAEQGTADEELKKVLRRAEQGDLTVLEQLRRLLDETPQLWQQFGDLALQAEGATVKLVGGGNLLLCECLLRKVADLKAELAGPAASALERLLAQRV